MGNHMRIAVRRGGAGLAGLALLAGAVAGCSSTSEDASGGPGSADTVTETVTPSPTSEPTSEPTSSPTSDASPGDVSGATGSGGDPTSTAPSGSGSASVPLCGTPDLRAAIAPARGGGTAGASHDELSLTNRADHPCRMKGWAGVSFVAGSDGHQIGAAADRTGADQRRFVTLIPNARAVEEIAVTSAGKYAAAQCRPTQARGFRIYPPDNRESLFVAAPTRACAASGVHLLSVAPVHAVS